jgi:SAM-dependent methyltransferase
MAEHKTSELLVCCICGCARTKIHLRGGRHSLDRASFGSSRTKLSVGNILRCEQCGFGFSEVRPEERQLGELYRDLDVATYEAEAPGRLITARRHLRILHRYFKQRGRLLDVGCASGRFLAEAKSAGWDVTGVEPSTTLFEMAMTLLNGKASIYNSTLQQAETLPAYFFEAITMWDVLEHVIDPVAFLQLACSLLKPGGYLILNIPNLDSMPARFLGSRWPLILPEHLNYFNTSSLKIAAEKAGLKAVHFGSRPAAFSLAYVTHRLGQHAFPGSKIISGFLSNSLLGPRVVHIYMGELCAALVKP